MKNFITVVALATSSLAFAANQTSVASFDETNSGTVFSEEVSSSAEGLGVALDEQTDVQQLGTVEAARPVNAACAAVKLTENQKTQIKDAFTKFKQNEVQLKANLKAAGVEFMDVVNAPASNLAAGQGAGTKLTTAHDALIGAKVDLDVNILFGILAAEQRKPAIECARSMRRHHGCGHGHHGSGHGHGGHGHPGHGHGGGHGGSADDAGEATDA